MGKRIKIFPLLIAPLLLSSCSGARVKEVNFKSYGEEVSASYFASRYEKRLKDITSLYFDTTNIYSTPYENLKIKFFNSSVDKYYDSAKAKSYTYYQQTEESDHFDYVHNRFLNNSVTKYYASGDLPNITTIHKLIEKGNYYAETTNAKTVLVDLDDCTYKSVSQTYYEFHLYELLYLFLGRIIVTEQGSTLDSYYISDNTFTYVHHESVRNENIIQVNLYDKIDLLIKSVTSTVSPNDPNITIDSVYNAQLTVEITRETIAKVDYSNYTPIDVAIA